MILTNNSVRLINLIVTKSLIHNVNPIINDVVPPQHGVSVLVGPSSVTNLEDVLSDLSSLQTVKVLVELYVEGHQCDSLLVCTRKTFESRLNATLQFR